MSQATVGRRTATIRNRNTCEAYHRALRHLFELSEYHQPGGLDDIEPLHTAAPVEQLSRQQGQAVAS